MMTEFVVSRFHIVMCCRMLNSRAYDMAGVQSCLFAPRYDT